MISMATHEPANDIGLALSGGGYRASVFHLGTLKKLNELGILSNVDVISTISGGSITGAAWCLYSGPYQLFHAEMIKKFNTQGVIGRIIFSFEFLFAILIFAGLIAFSVYLTFTSNARWAFATFALFLIVFFLFQYKIFPVSKVIERAYDNIFYDKKTLAQLLPKHKLAIGSSNLHSGRPFTFSRDRMGDSAYANWQIEEFKDVQLPDGAIKKEIVKTRIKIEFDQQKFPVARAVMASSCVPFAFTPISIGKMFFKNADHFKLVVPVLVDGGVYDNQGIQKITQARSGYECRRIIVSDAGGSFIGDHKYKNVIALLMRTVNLFMYRIKTGQMVKNIYDNYREKPIAYFSLGWNIKECIPGFVDAMCNDQVLKSVLDSHQLDPKWIEKPDEYRAAITEKLKKNVGYSEIEKRNVPEPFLTKIKATGTSLKRFKMDRINGLIAHAENLTELQVKLYCPNLFK
jgi:NTE family protein